MIGSAHEIYTQPEVTQKLLDDSAFSVDDFLNEEITKEFARRESTAVTTGDGLKKPRGFLDYTIVSTSDATRSLASCSTLRLVRLRRSPPRRPPMRWST